MVFGLLVRGVEDVDIALGESRAARPVPESLADEREEVQTPRVARSALAVPADQAGRMRAAARLGLALDIGASW